MVCSRGERKIPIDSRGSRRGRGIQSSENNIRTLIIPGVIRIKRRYLNGTYCSLTNSSQAGKIQWSHSEQSTKKFSLWVHNQIEIFFSGRCILEREFEENFRLTIEPSASNQSSYDGEGRAFCFWSIGSSTWSVMDGV
jgi:hypothetical protein